MKKAAWIAGAGILFLVAVLWYARLAWYEAIAQDAVQVISYDVRDLYLRSPGATEADIEQVILGLGRGGVIDVKKDREGRPTDPWGTRYRVRHSVDGTEGRVTVTSAGWDGTFGNRNDLEFDHRYEVKPRK